MLHDCGVDFSELSEKASVCVRVRDTICVWAYGCLFHGHASVIDVMFSWHALSELRGAAVYLCVCVCKVCMRALTAGGLFKCLCLLPYVFVLNKHHLWKAHRVCLALGLCHGKAVLVLPCIYVCWDYVQGLAGGSPDVLHQPNARCVVCQAAVLSCKLMLKDCSGRCVS